MLPGLVVPLIVILFLPIVSFLVVPSLLTNKKVAISRSSAEPELCAMTLMIAKVTWLCWLVEDFGLSVSANSSFV
jgi:Trk-type K+ transport system membrane component